MVFIFPLIGVFLSLITVLLLKPSGAFLIYGILYTLGYTLALALLYVFFIALLAFFVNLKKPNEKFSKFYNFIVSFTLKIALSACNVKVSVEGIEKIPTGRFVLVQNHKSMFDPIVSLAYLGKYELGFITKPENFNIPIINRYMHKICCIGIDRENPRNAVKSINAAVEHIKNDNCSIAVYPEGTRSKESEMLPFHAGSFKIATKSGVPLVITTVDHTDLVHKNAPFKRTNIKLNICAVIPAEEVKASSTAELSDRAREIMLSSL